MPRNKAHDAARRSVRAPQRQVCCSHGGRRLDRLAVAACSGIIAALTIGPGLSGSLTASARVAATAAHEVRYQYTARGPHGYSFDAGVLFRDNVPVEVQEIRVTAGRCWRDSDHGPVKPFPTAWFAATYLKVGPRGNFSDKHVVRHLFGMPVPRQGTVTGHVDAKRITGALRRPIYHMQVHGVPVTCNTGVVRFVARRGRATWTGSTP